MSVDNQGAPSPSQRDAGGVVSKPAMILGAECTLRCLNELHDPHDSSGGCLPEVLVSLP